MKTKLVLFLVCVLTAPLLVLSGTKKPYPSISTYFSYDHSLPYLVEFIGTAHKTLDIACYGLNNDALVLKIIQMSGRGVKVRIITDKTQAGGKSQKIEIQKLVNAKIPLEITKGRRGTIMHDKFCVVDSLSYETGSFNWTNNADKKNEENFIVVKGDRANALRFLNEFQKIWNFQIQKDSQ